MKTIRHIGVGLIIFSLVGCGNTTSGQSGTTATSTTAIPTTETAAAPTNSPFPTLTAPSLQPPRQHNEGHPDVAFDPCTWIPDEIITKIGFDPKTRARGIGDIIGESTSLVCGFKTVRTNQFGQTEHDYGLSIISRNHTFEEGRSVAEREILPGGKTVNMQVNNREAFRVDNPRSPESCDVFIRTKVGYVIIMRHIRASAQDRRPCQGMPEIAAAIEPSIGKDN